MVLRKPPDASVSDVLPVPNPAPVLTWRIGEFQPDEHWTSIVSPELAARMLESETQMLAFNLLALHGNAEEQTNGEAEEIPGRRKDHTPAIHEWVKKLADHGALLQLHEEAKLRNSP